jgi:nucleotide-binding universal stress UspA family protein/uncharacterized ParB-like nuclease family protein
MPNYATAVNDFRQARRKAAMEEIVARLAGKSTQLLSFEDARRSVADLDALLRPKELKEIPLNAIVGSVGRQYDFTRSFLPLRDSDEDRWVRIEHAQMYEGGTPPIEVYQLGEAYFVLDGNHRVSVARRLGADTIEAYVTTIPVTVPITPDTSPEDLIIKERQARFLEKTGLTRYAPAQAFEMSHAGHYETLLEQIEEVRQKLAQTTGRIHNMQIAASHWYEHIYEPVISAIRRRNLLEEHPGRTEADLYVWLVENRYQLEEQLQWNLPAEATATDLAEQAHHRRRKGFFTRTSEAVQRLILPESLRSGPSAGTWRKRLELRAQMWSSLRDQVLFRDILVPLRGTPDSWQALYQAVEIAHLEGGQVLGLHIRQEISAFSAPQTATAGEIEAKFRQVCLSAGVPHQFALEENNQLTKTVVERARWADLIVMHISQRPSSKTFSRLAYGTRTIVLQSARPVWLVPAEYRPIRQVLLAFDGSEKSKEALYIAAYIGTDWKAKVTVLTSKDKYGTELSQQDFAYEYLKSFKVDTNFLQKTGDEPADVILQSASECNADVILVGGYGYNPVMEWMLGSTVNGILQKSKLPVCVCQ